MNIPVSHSQQRRGSGVLEPAVSFMGQQGLLIARSVCSMEHGGSVIRVLNPSPAPVMVYSNQKVGILQPLSKVEGVCAVEESHRGIQKRPKQPGGSSKTDDIPGQGPVQYRKRESPVPFV